MNSTKKIISAAVLAISTIAGHSASAAASAVRLNIPFAFVVAGRTMPAGVYTVGMSGSVISISGQRSSVLVAGGPRGVSRNAEPGLIFSRRSGTAYLVGVRTDDDARSIGVRDLH